MSAMCAQCGAKKSHSIHLKALAMAGHHPYLDASKPGLKPISDPRAAYQASQMHKDAYEAVAGSGCAFEAAGAPTECRGRISPHHVVPRSVSGSLEISETFPVVAACIGHNSDVESDVALRAWAERATFVWHVDGNEYFYRYNQRMYRAAVKQRAALGASR